MTMRLSRTAQTGLYIAGGILVLAVLYAAKLVGYLLFHTLVEMAAIAVSFSIFILTWNARDYIKNGAIEFVGAGHLFLAGFDLVHTLAYSGMNVLPVSGANPPTQLWIAARSLQAASLAVAPLFASRSPSRAWVLPGYALVSAALAGAIFTGRFPVCFVEGMGLTAFKVNSEYVIIALLAVAGFGFYQVRARFEREVLALFLGSILATMAAEFMFTRYASAFAPANMAGHFLKLLAVYCLYQAILVTGIRRPFQLIFRELRQAAEDLDEHRLQLEAANEKLKDLDRLKSMFIASMSHELRTPLNSIIGFTGVILQGMSGPLSDRQQDQLQRVFGSARHLLALITDVIDISKIEAGRIEVFPERLRLREVVDEAAASLQTQFRDKGLALEVRVPETLSLFTDRKRLMQCILNYMSNAIKYSRTGTVTVTAQEENGRVRITVRDTGIGIAAGDLPLLFTAFHRLDSPLKVTATGTGLGLYLTRKIATELLRGEVGVESTPGQGSTFTLTVARELPAQGNV